MGESDWPTYKAKMVTDGVENEEVEVPYDVLLQDRKLPGRYEALEFIHAESDFTPENFNNMMIRPKNGENPIIKVIDVRHHSLAFVKTFSDNGSESWKWTLTEAPKEISLLITQKVKDNATRNAILNELKMEYKDKFGQFPGGTIH